MAYGFLVSSLMTLVMIVSFINSYFFLFYMVICGELDG